mmetsp:Transcript_25830/g.64068  ORF Transcript_25830/g.64068 Transcript_25830/m.64068 type:complete len:285 (-) Transcript_25830:146-1000(-)
MLIYSRVRCAPGIYSIRPSATTSHLPAPTCPSASTLTTATPWLSGMYAELAQARLLNTRERCPSIGHMLSLSRTCTSLAAWHPSSAGRRDQRFATSSPSSAPAEAAAVMTPASCTVEKRNGLASSFSYSTSWYTKRSHGHVASHTGFRIWPAPSRLRPRVRIRCARMKAAERESDAWQWTSTWPPDARAASICFETNVKLAFASPAHRSLSRTDGSAQRLCTLGFPASKYFRSSGSSSRSMSSTRTSGPQKPVRAAHWHGAVLTTSLMGALLVAAASFCFVSMS